MPCAGLRRCLFPSSSPCSDRTRGERRATILLPLLERAERAARRRNKAAAAGCPPFPDHYAAAVEEQVAQTERYDLTQKNEEW
jgi:hypothetical protein